MKKILLGAAALIALRGPAFAADMPARTYTKAPAYTAPARWSITGPASISAAMSAAPLPAITACRAATRRFLGGVQGGFDYQFAPNWVLGAEAQYCWLGGGNNNGVLFPGGTLGDRQQPTSSAR